MENNNLNIVPIEIDDADKLIKLIQQYYPAEDVTYFVNVIMDTLTPDAKDKSETYVVVKDSSGDIHGLLGHRNLIDKFKRYSVKDKPLEIYALFVDKERLRSGVGTMLVDFLKMYAVEKGYSEIIVRSAYKFKETSWAFYEKLGFELVGEVEEKAGELSRVYRLVL